MPMLSPTNRTSQKVILPSSTPTDEAWVELYDKMLTADMLDIQEVEENKTLASLKAVTNCIKAWNFTESDGTIAPIDFDHVKFLPLEDFIHIISQIKTFDQYSELSTDIKKKPPFITQPSESENELKIPS